MRQEITAERLISEVKAKFAETLQALRCAKGEEVLRLQGSLDALEYVMELPDTISEKDKFDEDMGI